MVKRARGVARRDGQAEWCCLRRERGGSSHVEHSFGSLEPVLSVERVFLILLDVVMQNLSEDVDVPLCKFLDL